MSTKIFRNKKGKSGEIPPWLILVVLAAVFLLPQSPLNLFSIFGGEKDFVWHELNWKYNSENTADPNADSLGVSTSGEALMLGISCNHPSNCGGYFKSDFDLSRFVEAKILITANTAAHIGGNSMAASGSFNFAIDGVGYASVVSYAEERGGTQIFSDSDRTEATITLLRTDSGWDIFKNDIKVANTSKLSPEIRFSLGAGGSQQSAGGSASAEIFFQAKNSSLLVKKLLCEATKGAYLPTTNECVCPSNSKGYADGVGCDYNCLPNEVKLIDGSCKTLIRTCVDNNLNNICDADDPIVYQDPDSNAPVCSDRDNDRVCDDVASLFCKDSNNNKICDSDEVRWYSTYCPDTNGNGVCDGIESGTVLCPITYAPVCDSATNITFPNGCFASGFGITATEAGACKVPPIIIRLDCATGAVPIPSGYLCQPETGFLYRVDKIYQNITLDCRNLSPLESYTCEQIGTSWVYTRTEFIDVDCFSRGCPSGNLCQAGVCVASSKRCPEDINCEQTYGSGTTCGESVGLCVKTQYLTQDCSILGCPSGNTCVSQNSSKVCVKSQVTAFVEPSGVVPVFGKTPSKIPWTAIIIIGLLIAGGAVLASRKH